MQIAWLCANVRMVEASPWANMKCDIWISHSSHTIALDNNLTRDWLVETSNLFQLGTCIHRVTATLHLLVTARRSCRQFVKAAKYHALIETPPSDKDDYVTRCNALSYMHGSEILHCTIFSEPALSDIYYNEWLHYQWFIVYYAQPYILLIYYAN